jgi:hemoglobin
LLQLRRRRTVKHVSGILALVVAAGFSGSAFADGTLYAHLGGEAGVGAIATSLIDHVAGDPALGRSFEGTNLALIKQHLAAQLCELSGGPCHYDGDNMRDVHAGHDISEAEFYGLVSALRVILQQRGVALADRNRLLALLAPMKRDVVRVPPAGK